MVSLSVGAIFKFFLNMSILYCIKDRMLSMWGWPFTLSMDSRWFDILGLLLTFEKINATLYLIVVIRCSVICRSFFIYSCDGQHLTHRSIISNTCYVLLGNADVLNYLEQ